jgi:transcriptional regulator with XRE-family HTH domain
MDNAKLARRLRAFRKLKQFTQREFAELTSISLNMLGEIERGHREVNEELLQTFAEKLGIRVEELTDV